jgi:hypothetical protein
MPRPNKSNKRLRQPTDQRKRNQQRSSQRVVSLSPVRAGFPYSLRTQLTYVTSVQLTISGTACGVRSFAANGLYDPDITGVGHQPLGFDTFASVYLDYLVTGSQLSVIGLSPSDLTNGAPSAVGVLLSNSPTLAYNGADALMEQGLSRYKVMCNAHPLYQETIIASNPYSPRKFFNVRNPQDLQDAIGAAVTANPIALAYFNVWFGQTPSGSDVDTYNMTVRITYDVQFFTLKEIPQS